VSFFVWNLNLDLSGLGDPASSYATAGLALGFIGTCKPHHHDKVETPLVGPKIFHWFTNISFITLGILPALFMTHIEGVS
jgi:hypothetical protein